jgi:fatty acyl-CoA reductase
MVVNAMMVAMAAHSEEQSQTIYHVASSVRNPAPYAILADSGHRYFFDNPPRTGRNGQPARLNKMRFFSTVARLSLYMAIKYRLPLEVSCTYLSSDFARRCDQSYSEINLAFSSCCWRKRCFAS